MRIALAALLALAGIAPAAATPCDGIRPPQGAYIEGQVTRVVSGDSFCLATPAGPVWVKLAGFAACRTEATRLNLTKIVGGKRVICTVTHRARTRVSARCTVEGHSVVEVLRRAGTCERR
jgi:hypothetical protein